MRIASLLPAATEIVGALGLADELVAVTFECDEPDVRDRCRVVVESALPADLDSADIDAVVRDRAARGLPMYDLDRDALRAADPDLVLTQDLCRVCALPAGTVADALDTLGLDATVCSVDPHTFSDVLTAIEDVGGHAQRADTATMLVADLHGRLGAVARAVDGRRRPRVLVLEWTEPPYLAGHWVPELVRRAGGEPVAGVDGGRSVAAGWDELQREEVDVALVSPCGLGLVEAVGQAETVRRNLPGVPLIAIDSSSYVVRAGPRLVDGVEALAWALHPDAVAEPPAGRLVALG